MRQKIRPLLLMKRRNALFQRVGSNTFAKSNQLMDETIFGSPRMVAGWLDSSCAGPAPASLNLFELAAFLIAEGWNAQATVNTVIVNGEEETREFLMACDFSTVEPNGLAHDLCEGMQLQGLCLGECN